MREFTAAIGLEPQNADFFHNRGFSFRKMVRFGAVWGSAGGSARSQPKLWRTSAPECSCSWLLLPCNSHACTVPANPPPPLLQERYRDAVHDYSRALQLNPGHVKAYYNRAVALERLQQPEAALRDYGRVVELDPANSSAHLNTGLLLCKLGRWVKGQKRAGRRQGMCYKLAFWRQKGASNHCKIGWSTLTSAAAC